MPVGIEIDIEGADMAASRLREISDSLSQSIGDALREGAELIVSLAQANAPVRTGNLRDSIQVTDQSETSVTVVAEAEYAGYVEHGTRYMDAQPFFEPAVEEAKERIEQLIRNAISNR